MRAVPGRTRGPVLQDPDARTRAGPRHCDRTRGGCDAAECLERMARPGLRPPGLRSHHASRRPGGDPERARLPDDPGLSVHESSDDATPMSAGTAFDACAQTYDSALNRGLSLSGESK